MVRKFIAILVGTSCTKIFLLVFPVIFMCMAGCASRTTSATMKIKPFHREVELCPVHPRYASFKIESVVVLPFNNSDKSTQEYWFTPDKSKKFNKYEYPIIEDGEYIGALLENELINTFKYRVIERGKLRQVMKEFALGQSGILNADTARQAGKLIGADAIIMGTVYECYGKLKTQKKGNSYLVVQPVYVSFSAKMIEVEKGMILFNCQKSGNSFNYLAEEFTFTSSEAVKEGFSKIDAAFHGGNAKQRIDYVGRKLLRETVQQIP